MDGGGGGTVGVVGEVGAELHVVVLEGLVVEVGFGAIVVDARMQPHIHALREALVGVGRLAREATAHVVAVLGVGPCDVHEEVGLDNVVPAQGGNAVAPFPVEVQLLQPVALAIIGVVDVFLVLRVDIHLVVARVKAEEQTILVGELMVELQVEVVEVIAAPGGAASFFGLLLHHDVHDGCGEQVVVSATEREVERGLAFDDGAFHVHLGGNQADAEVAVVLVHVAVFHAHVDHRGETTSETCREVAFI